MSSQLEIAYTKAEKKPYRLIQAGDSRTALIIMIIGLKLYHLPSSRLHKSRRFRVDPRPAPATIAAIVKSEFHPIAPKRHLGDHPKPAIDDHLKTGQR